MEGKKLGREDIFSVSMENLRWFQKNYAQLKRKYGNKWVLVHERKIISTGNSFEEILPSAQKYEPSSVMLEYIKSDEVAMFF